jgi:LacI family transcriptional regulator
MAVTIRQIAHKAGVSYASVSRALNDRPGVGPRTKKRIRTIAARMGYTADAQARALVTGIVPFVGLVVPDITNPFYPALARGAQEILDERGYSLLLQDTEWQVDRVRHSFELLTSRRVAGLLMAAGLDGLVGELGLSWRSLRQSVVLVGQAAPARSGALSVTVDDRQGGRLVGHHLAQRGWRRIAYVAGPKGDPSSRARLEGLQEALGASGGKARVSATSHGSWTVHSGYEQACSLLSGRRRPDAVFAANDLLAIGVARAARERNLSLGRRLGLVGYDDIALAAHLEVPLTTVAQPKIEVGREAARLLVDTLTGKTPQRQLTLEPTLIVRSSCGSNAA